MRRYLNKPIGELAAELSTGLVRLRKSYIDAAEQLIRMIDPEQSYPYEFVVFRLTGFRPEEGERSEAILAGKSLRRDLQNLMLDVSDSFEFHTSEYREVVYDSHSLARQHKVSTKTIQRWRKRGLPARRLIFPDGRRRIGFLESSLQWFIDGHEKQVRRGAQFTQMTDEERDDILRRARRMTRMTDCSLTDIARHLAKRTGRAVETVRYTIRKHDTESPREAIFPQLLESLGDEERMQIYRHYLRGVSVPNLAERYNRTRGSIYRIVNEMRAQQLIERPISYVFNEEFDEPDAEEVILSGAVRLSTKQKKKVKPPSDLPPYLKSLYEVPLLSPEAERDLFRRYNYLKYKADTLRRRIDINRVKAGDVKDVESLLLQANVIKNRIVRANLRLVVSIAKKHIVGPMSLFELISDGNVSLMRAVEKFDYGRGYRFSTYASWAIMRNFARSVPKEKQQIDRFSTGNDEILDIAAGLNSYDPDENNAAELRESIQAMLSHLSSRERTILIDHYGLDQTGDSKTFDQLGRQLGISKERVRQIEVEALEKLREISANQ
jgi:RNA polymerase sigma factor (sigma-70 family)